MIKSNDPGAANRALHEDLHTALSRVLDSGFYILGPEVEAFEKEFARYLGGGHVVGVASGTDALELALRALDIGPGDAVLTLSHTAVATVAAIESAGATPVLAEIDPQTFTVSVASLRRCLDHYDKLRFKALVPVHLYGQTADMDGIMNLAGTHNLKVIEDASQAHGAAWQGRAAGSFGDASSFSFYPTKNLGALGDGGAVYTASAALENKLRKLRQYGWSRRHFSEIKGLNSRLDELQAAILRVKLEHLDSGNLRRNEIARIYDNELGEVVTVPHRSPGCTCHAYHQYTIRATRRNELQSFLSGKEIATSVLYPVPIHLQPAYSRILQDPEGLRETEKAASEILCLPMYPELSGAEVSAVCQAIRSFYSLTQPSLPSSPHT